MSSATMQMQQRIARGAGAGPPIPPPLRSPLDESHFALIRQGVRNRRGVRRAARTALASAIVTMVIGFTALPFAIIWPSPEGLLLTVGICVVGGVELLGSRRMRRAAPSAATLLGRNQLALLALIVIYCAVQMLTFSTAKARAAAISPEAREQMSHLPRMEQAIDEQIDRWAPILTYGFYGVVIFASLCFQGGMAAYYFTRRRRIEAFNRSSPAWVRRLFLETDA